jgi:hypothetical protein
MDNPSGSLLIEITIAAERSPNTRIPLMPRNP